MLQVEVEADADQCADGCGRWKSRGRGHEALFSATKPLPSRPQADFPAGDLLVHDSNHVAALDSECRCWI